jgi:hypothetical protein
VRAPSARGRPRTASASTEYCSAARRPSPVASSASFVTAA